MKKVKKNYKKPIVKSEKEKPEVNYTCPSTNARYCRFAYTPKKG